MNDISEIVGVSKVTVSKVFNNRDDISEEVKRKVLQVAEELGYRYNPGVKTLKTGIPIILASSSRRFSSSGMRISM